jgi:hypothetical protein
MGPQLSSLTAIRTNLSLSLPSQIQQTDAKHLGKLMYTAQSTLIIFWHAMMSDQLLAEGKSERRLGFLKPCF